MPKTQAEVRAERREKQNAELAKRKEQAEKAVKSTSGLVSRGLSSIQKALAKRRRLLD